MKIIRKLVTVGFLCLVATATANAQTFPDKPLRLVVGYVPGGVADAFCRTMGQALGERLKQPVVVDNKPGAGGTLAALFVAKSTDEGYTLLMAEDGALGVAPSIYQNLGYNPTQDFAPVSLSVTQPMVLLATPGAGVKDLAGLIALAKSKPRVLNFASPGNATTPHLAFELLKAQAGIEVTHVPYKGGTPALLDLVAGRVEFLFIGINNAFPFIQDGKAVPIGVTSLTRQSRISGVPPISEAGIPGFSSEPWFGLAMPARAPRPIVNIMERETQAVLEQPDVREKLVKLGMQVAAGNAEALATRIREDVARYARIIKQTGIRAD